MKGIKKLFFGLIFLTLFSVGFKVDAKAGVSFVEPDFSEENATVYAKISGTIPKEQSHDYAVNLRDDSFTITVGYDEDTKEYDLENKEDYYDWNISGNKFWVELPLITKEEIYSEMTASGDSQKKQYKVTSSNLGSGTYTATAYPVKIEAWHGGNVVGKGKTVEFSDPTPDYVPYKESSNTFYLLKGDLASITMDFSEFGEMVTVQKTENVYDYNPAASPSVITVDGKGKKYTAKVIIGVEEDFIDIPELSTGRKVGLNYWSAPLKYYYEGDDIENAVVYLGDQKLSSNNFIFDESEQTFRFKGVGTVGTKTLKITLNGATKEFKNIQIVDTSKITIKVPGTVTAYIGLPASSYSVTTTGAKTEGFIFADTRDAEFEDPHENGDGYFTAETNKDSSFAVSAGDNGEKKGLRLFVSPKSLDVDVYKEDSDADDGFSEIYFLSKHVYSVTVNVLEPGDLILDDNIYVNEGLKIKLNKFVSGYDSSLSGYTVSVTNSASSYISIPSSGELGKIEVTGKSAGYKKEGLEVNGVDANVTVYKKPTLTLDSSSSSSSSSSYSNASYKFTAKMPGGLYHDDKKVSSLSEVEFTVISSSGDEKSLKKITSSSGSTSSSVESRSFTTTITAREIADALGKSSDSVKIRAYAYDGSKDDKVYAEYSLSYNTGSSSSSSSSSGSGKGGEGGSGSEYDDVPKTGESKTDIWVLWTVLFIAILGAGFMIYKRFGLVRAIAEAEEEFAAAEHEERVEAARKEKEDKINMLKDLRNL